MGIHFYKLHCGGNSFVLVDTTEKSNNNIIQPENFARASIKLCSRKFGIGARGAIFLLKDNLVRILTGKETKTLKAGMAGFVPAGIFLTAAKSAEKT